LTEVGLDWTFVLSIKKMNSLKIKLQLTLLISSFSLICYGQTKELPITIPSPNVANLGIYGEVPVSNYTGVPNIKVPIYTIENRNISLPVELTYHVNSVKPNIHPSWVGLGWSLKAGGVISRVQHGYTDEFQWAGQFNIGFLNHPGALAQQNWDVPLVLWSHAHNKKPGYVPYAQLYDSEPDEFNFNFLGYSGKFLMDHTGNWTVVSNQNIKVEIAPNGLIGNSDLPARILNNMPNNGSNVSNTSQHLNSFIITTPDGTKYTFGGVDNHAVEFNVNYRVQPYSHPVAVSWHLSEIEGIDGQKISLEYEEDDHIVALSEESSYYKKYVSAWTNSAGISCCNSNDNRGPQMSGSLIFPVYLSKILTDGEYLQFYRSTSQELRYTDDDLYFAPESGDSYGDYMTYLDQYSNTTTLFDQLQWKKLDKIRLFKPNSIKHWELNYIENSNERLKLSSIQEFGQSNGSSSYASNPPYSFTYSPMQLPAYLTEDIDHWGFYNGYSIHTWGGNHKNVDVMASTSAVGIDDWMDIYFNSREPYLPQNWNGPNYGLAETLEEIQYPTGGTTQFEFERNDYSKVVDTLRTNLENLSTLDQLTPQIGLIGLTRPSCEMFPSVSSTFSGKDQNLIKFKLRIRNCNGDNYSQNASGPIIRIKLENTSGVAYATYQYADYSNSDYEEVGYFNDLFPGIILDPNTEYRLHLEDAASTGTNERPYVELRLFHEEGGMNYAGGLRIRKITKRTEPGKISGIKEYSYAKIFNDNIVGSSGILGGKSRYWWDDWSKNTQDASGNVVFHYDIFQSSNVLPYGLNQGSHIGYSEVTIKDADSLGNTKGKTVYNYTNFDEDIWGESHMDEPPMNSINPKRSMYSPFTSLALERGQLTSERIYNDYGQLLKRTTHKYARSSQDFIRRVKVDYQSLCEWIFYAGSFSTNDPIGVWNFGLYSGSSYKTYKGSYNLVETKVSEYFPVPGNFTQFYDTIKTVSKISYNTFNYPNCEELINSDGTSLKKRTKYSNEFQVNTASDWQSSGISLLNDQNVIVPIEEISTIESNNNESIIDGKMTLYKDFNGIPKPFENWRMEIQTPQNYTPNTTSITNGVFSKSALYKTKGQDLPLLELSAYNSKGALTEYKPQFGNSNIGIWSADGRRVLASVNNATLQEFAYKSLNGISIVNPVIVNITPSNENQAQKFIMKVFIKTSNDQNGQVKFKVMNASSNALIATITSDFKNCISGEYVYQEFMIDLSQIRNDYNINSLIELKIEGSIERNTGQVNADQLRLQPIDAIAKTLVYDNERLLRSLDNNYRYKRFEYDKMGRLQLVKNDDSDIEYYYEYDYLLNGAQGNFIKKSRPRIPGIKTVSDLNNLSANEKIVNIDYYDGLGRSIQTILLGQSGYGNDLISFHEYDPFGRESKEYLPYSQSSFNEAFRTNTTAMQSVMYGSLSNAYAYTEQQTDNSPLNRLQKIGHPGSTWKIGSGRETSFIHRTNSQSEVVNIHSNGTSNYYGPGTLLVESKTDEDGNQITTYKDKLGHIIMSNNEGATTYYVRNEFQQIIAIIPPEVYNEMSLSANYNFNTPFFKNGIFRYYYDANSNVIRKQFPGTGTYYIYYDRLNRPVLTIEPNGVKKFMKFNKLGQEIADGILNSNQLPNSTQSLYEKEANNGYGYTLDQAFPTADIAVRSITYYDHYDFNRNQTVDQNETFNNTLSTTYNPRVYGQKTGTKGVILDGNENLNTATFLNSRFYYDSKFNLIQSIEENYTGQEDERSFIYDFNGNITDEQFKHRSNITSPQSLILNKQYTFDLANRPQKTYLDINNTGQILISKKSYDNKNNLVKLQLGATDSNETKFLQNIDYKYNIRGWLTDINRINQGILQISNPIKDTKN
jgi:hypothetical protein